MGRRGQALTEKIAIPIDVCGEVERVLPRETLRQFSVAPLQRLDNFQMIDDRAGGPVILCNRGAADCAYMNEQVTGRIDDGL